MAGRASRDMTEGPVFGHIMRMVIPMSFAIVAMMLTGIVDAYWVGRLGTAQQAAVQMSFPVSMLMMSVAIGLGAGAVSAVSRAAGKKDFSSVRRIATDALTLALLMVGAVSILGILLVEPLFRIIGATETMMPHVTDYMTVWFAGNVLIVGPMVASNVLRAIGNAVVPSMMMILAAVVNLILDPFFIFAEVPFIGLPGLGWGVSGAALATVAANAVTFLLVGWYLAFREKLIDFSWPGFSEVFHHWGEIARVGIPACISNTFNPLSMVVVMGGFGMAQFGDAAVAGVGVGGRLEAFGIVPLFALSASIGAVAGQNGGAELTDRVRRAFLTSFAFCLGWGLLVALVLIVAQGPLAASFLPSEAGREVAQLYWMLVTLTVFGYGITIAASAGFNGLGRPSYGVMITSSRAVMVIGFSIAGAFIAGGPIGVIAGLALANLLSGVGTAAYVLTRAPMTAKAGKGRKTPKPPAAEPVSAVPE